MTNEMLARHIAEYLERREPDSYGDISAAFTSVQRDLIVTALRAQSDVRAPTIDDVPSCGQENDYRRATPDVRAPAPQGEPISPADLAEVLENVRKGINEMKRREHDIPTSFHRACLALTHIVEGAGK